MVSVPVVRTDVRLSADPSRVITKRFEPGGGHGSSRGLARTQGVLTRIGAIPDLEVAALLRTTEDRFGHRHRDLRSVFEANFTAVAGPVISREGLSEERRLLIGAYFTHEYSIESAALSNPSIVLAPDQQGLSSGQQRFLLSLRAIGEGHISSVEFRTGVVDASGHVEMEVPSPQATTAARRASAYDKATFRSELGELHADNAIAADLLDSLPDPFSLAQLEAAIAQVDDQHGPSPDATRATRTLHWLASSTYESEFSTDSKLSERVLFPASATESNGIEDARFVRFTREDGRVTYFATYTAYDGYQILPQLIETQDFRAFRMSTLSGEFAKNKGIALFPRMVGGRFAALGRVDNESNFLMWSDNIRSWQHGERIQVPMRPWEIMQLGNGGSPLETEAGWLVITHGVGPLRQYALGAILLDKQDPSRLIGHLAEPLLEPASDERDGYVPNVVYSCGSMITNGLLVLPYGVSDIGTRIATVRLDDLLEKLTSTR